MSLSSFESPEKNSEVFWFSVRSVASQRSWEIDPTSRRESLALDVFVGILITTNAIVMPQAARSVATLKTALGSAAS